MKLISKKTLLLFFLPGAIFMGAFLIYPIFKMVFDSFFKVGITGARTFIGFDNYIKAFTAGGFLKQLKNTLIYILIAVSVETVLGFIFALLFELDYFDRAVAVHALELAAQKLPIKVKIVEQPREQA